MQNVGGAQVGRIVEVGRVTRSVHEAGVQAMGENLGVPRGDVEPLGATERAFVHAEGSPGGGIVLQGQRVVVLRAADLAAARQTTSSGLHALIIVSRALLG